MDESELPSDELLIVYKYYELIALVVAFVCVVFTIGVMVKCKFILVKYFYIFEYTIVNVILQLPLPVCPNIAGF